MCFSDDLTEKLSYLSLSGQHEYIPALQTYQPCQPTAYCQPRQPYQPRQPCHVCGDLGHQPDHCLEVGVRYCSSICSATLFCTFHVVILLACTSDYHIELLQSFLVSLNILCYIESGAVY